jgi:guanylate cyclase
VTDKSHPAIPAAGPVSTIEDPEVVRRLRDLVSLSSVVSIAAFAGVFFFFGEPVAGWATAAYAGADLVLLLGVATGAINDHLTVAAGAFTGIAVANHVAVHVSLGGFAHSGGYLFWGVAVTLTAGLLLTRTTAVLLASGYCVGAIVLGLNEAALAASRPPPAAALTTILFVSVLAGSFFMLVPMFGYFLDRLAAERARSEALLLSILPAPVATRLKTDRGMIADRHEYCTVVFADLVDFTAHSRGKDPAEIVGELNTIFSAFDALVMEHHAEKIKTIGDGYMAACGLPQPDHDHAAHACDLALAMVGAMPSLNAVLGASFQLRVGLNSGSAVAGVVGASKFSYDVWGDTVNLASRLESNGVPGVVATSAAVAAEVQDRFVVQRLGVRLLKGQGPVEMFAVTGRRP